MNKNKVLSWCSQIMRFLLIATFVLPLAAISTTLHAETAYISDQLKVPLRSGATSGHRIIRFLRSGTAFTITDTEGEYTQVETNSGSAGWVLTEQVMKIPSARHRLAQANKTQSQSNAQVKKLKSALAEAKAEVRKLKGEQDKLQNERINLSNSLEDLKITAANPVAMSKKNKQLKKELEKVRSNEARLDKDNQQLRSNVMQEWFVIGGVVSIGSLLLGLLLTRINWRRKRDSWGDSF